MLNSKLGVQLCSKIYSDNYLNKSSIFVSDNDTTYQYKVIDSIDTSSNIFGGLEAFALLNGNDLVFVIRGADVGIGKSIFNLLGANKDFIPYSVDSHPIRSLFQDWFWNGFLGITGLVKFTQYYEMRGFYLNVVAKFKGCNYTVIGHSLGGAIAQRLSLEFDIKSINFSPISPWWTLGHIMREKLRSENLKDNNILNYYSSSDPFHYFPIFYRKIGVNKQISLKDYKSNSSLIAMIIERIYWAHGLNNYRFLKDGEIMTSTYESKIDKILNNLNFKCKKTFLLDGLIIVSGFIPTVMTWLFVHMIFSTILPTYHVSQLSLLWIFCLALISLTSTVIYMLPTLIIHTRWKYIIWILNITISWTGLGWISLFILAFILNSVAVDISKNNVSNSSVIRN